MEDLVLYEVTDRVGYITLNRPEKRNALSFDFVKEIKQKLKDAQSDDLCKVIVIKANGEAFCSGADLASLQKLQNNSLEENIADSKNLAELYLQIYQSPKIIISRVEGAAFAGGCGLATICDFTFATTMSRFAYTEVKIGFIPAIVMVFLLQQVGEKVAKQLLLTGDVFDAQKAYTYNLVNCIYDPIMIEEETHNFALRLCKQNSAQSMALTKKMIGKLRGLTLPDALEYASQMNAEARGSVDCKRGIASFLNKEKLIW
ncbi:MAG: enoyl-CoA hydratase/isomerase family protein [Bacteroidia bacterium]|nr:enoyl-CoA hydratase/isomerase family protein [Bacteroidia bacterium]